ncbi:hypothetical protein N9840_00935 [Gammaproteobacteria bacterium]|nr:hypothetical protein [Gammaproteobacteria bacterium]
MNENDKILINTYFDGELSAEEIKFVEHLISSNQEANNYANNIKRANVEINSYFETADFKELRSEISAFTDNLKSTNQKASVLDTFRSFFTTQSLTGYALTASIVYFVMLPVNESVIEEGYFSGNFSSFGNEINNYYYEKYRGADDLGDLSKDYIIETINKMIESRTMNSVMNYGDDSYFIKVEDLSIDRESLFCLEGYILNTGIKTQFLYCKSEKDETLTYLN